MWAVLKVSTLKNSGVHSTDVENLSESPTPEPDPESRVSHLSLDPGPMLFTLYVGGVEVSWMFSVFTEWLH